LNRRPHNTKDFSDEETARRRDAVIKHMLNTPPKPHSEMKLGKRKAKASPKAKAAPPAGIYLMQSAVEDILSPLAGDEMQREMDLIRELLLKLEALPMRLGEERSIPLDAEEIAVPGYDLNDIDYHLTQIRKSGYIDEGGARPMLGIGLRCLTPAGHDFLDSVRDPETWAKTKNAAARAGGFTINLLKDLANGFIKKQIEEKTGIKL
jgi:Hypothetical protein (DUF2513)